MSRTQTWLKMTAVGLGLCIGGPLFVEYIRPSDQELFNRFSPDIQQKSLEEGPRRAREFDEYVGKLKEWSKSDKSIWIAAQEQAEQKKEAAQAQAQAEAEAQAQRMDVSGSGSGNGSEGATQKEEMRKELLGGK